MIRRLLLMVGVVALLAALGLTVASFLLRADLVKETLPLDADVLGVRGVAAMPASTVHVAAPPLPIPARTPLPSLAVLQPGAAGYQGCTDTSMQYYVPDENSCSGPQLVVGSTNKAAALVKFDLTRLPDGVVGLGSESRVLEAKLSLYVVQSHTGTVIGAYLPRRTWDACAVTWKQPWQEPGADGAQDRESTALVEAAAPRAPGWLDLDVTAAVQSWLRDPAGNNGILLKSFDSRWSVQHILFSVDHPAVTLRPKLTIRYEAALATATPTVMPTVTPSPTASATPSPEATPTAPLSPRTIEVTWPARVSLGDPCVVKVVFRPAAAVRMSATSAVTRVLHVSANLSAPGFDTTSDSLREQILQQTDGSLAWTWAATPRLVGSQIMSLDLVFSWEPAAVGNAPALERGVWYRTRTVQIVKGFASLAQIGLWRNALLVLGVLCVGGWYLWDRMERQRN